MKKLINAPRSVVQEMIEGLVALYPGLAQVEGHTVVVRAPLPPRDTRPVAILSGGGSGHEPAHAGYVGAGMLTAAVAGDVFASPSPDAVLAGLRAAAGKAGALLIVKNYTGDRLNFGLAAELMRAEGTPVEVVVVADDVALADSQDHAGRRGLAGTVLVHKIAGAAAQSGEPLAEVARAAREAAQAVRTMGVALTPCTVPAAGKPGFTLEAGEIELGLGIHGEPGVRRGPLMPADALVDQLLARILADLKAGPGEKVVLLVNNLGGTPAMELAVVARRALAVLEECGLQVARAYAGTFLTALEMAGVSLSVMKVDARMLERLDAPTDAFAWPNAAARARTRTPPPSRFAPPPPEPRTEEARAKGRPLEAAVTRVLDALEREAARLSELDGKVGDGDMGTSLTRGAEAIRAALPGIPFEDPPAALYEMSQIVQRTIGGTSGPLYAVLLLRASVRLRGGATTPARWADALRAGTDGVRGLGGAAPGDCTMVDALEPAAVAAKTAAECGRAPAEILRAAADAAKDGAAATREMTPRRGRASYLGNRAVGHPDPGAEAVAVWLSALA